MVNAKFKAHLIVERERGSELYEQNRTYPEGDYVGCIKTVPICPNNESLTKNIEYQLYYLGSKINGEKKV